MVMAAVSIRAALRFPCEPAMAESVQRVFIERLTLQAGSLRAAPTRIRATSGEVLQQVPSETNPVDMEPKKVVRRRTSTKKALSVNKESDVKEPLIGSARQATSEAISKPVAQPAVSKQRNKKSVSSVDCHPEVRKTVDMESGADFMPFNGNSPEPTPVKRRGRPKVEKEDDDWRDEYETGWGFNYSDLFPDTPVQFMPPDRTWGAPPGMEKDEEVNEDLALWVNGNEEWEDLGEVRELTASRWEDEVLHSAVPVMVCVYDQYGPQREAGERQVKEAEHAAKKLWELGSAPLRVLTLDGSTEPLVAEALGIENPPGIILAFLGKVVFRTHDIVTAEDILQLTGHYLYKSPANAASRKIANEVSS